jgi:drug/metabolite transporter (DMT)-like permease
MINALIAFLFCSLIGVALKLIDDQIPVQQVVSLRFTLGFFILYLYYPTKKRQTFFSNLVEPAIFLRAFFGLCAFACFAYSIKYMSLSVWTAIQFTNPLMLALLAAIFLNERIPLLRYVAIAAGFAGVVIATNPFNQAKFDNIDKILPIFFLLLGCLSAALSDIFVKKLSLKYDSQTIVLAYCFFASLIIAPFSILTWEPPSLWCWLLIVVVAMLGVLFQLFLTNALAIIPASLVACLSYTSIIWSLLFGLIIFAEIPTTRELVGILFIMVDAFLAFTGNYFKPRKI